MDFIRRSGALVMGALVLQLSLGAGPSLCAEPVVIAEPAHAGMSMPADRDSCADTTDTDCVPPGDGACQTVMSCVTAVFNPATQSQFTVAVARDGAPVNAAQLLQTRSTVPDLPPPRA